MLYWGIEGEYYSVDAYGKPYRTTDQINNSQNPVWQNSNKAYLWSETAPKLEGRLESGYTLYINNLPWENVKMQMPSDVEVFNAYNVGSYAELMDPNPPKNAGWYPLWQCNPYNGGSETAAYNAYSKIDSTMMEYAPDMIMGKASDFDAVWQEYLVTMNGIGEPYVQFMQTQLNNRLKRYGGYPE